MKLYYNTNKQVVRKQRLAPENLIRSLRASHKLVTNHKLYYKNIFFFRENQLLA